MCQGHAVSQDEDEVAQDVPATLYGWPLCDLCSSFLEGPLLRLTVPGIGVSESKLHLWLLLGVPAIITSTCRKDG